MHAGTQARITLIAGMDPSGGAGLLRDVWTCEELAERGQIGLALDALCTGLTRQEPGVPATLMKPGLGGIEVQLQRLQGEVWKIGMLPAVMVEPLTTRLRDTTRAPRIVIFDPVQRASAGGLLGAAPELLRDLWGRCDWVTPNRAEALSFGARPNAGGAPWELGPFLSKARICWIKSALREDGRIVDELHLPTCVVRVGRAEQRGPDPRGTGCALASALAMSEWGELSMAGGPGETFSVWRQGRWYRETMQTLPDSQYLGQVLFAARWLATKRSQARRHRGAWMMPFSSGDFAHRR